MNKFFFHRTPLPSLLVERGRKEEVSTFAMPPPPTNVIVDHFGFELELTAEQVQARRACHEEASKREAKADWVAIERDRSSMPSHSELKKLARKVRARALIFFVFC